jgi:uncharacterized NAD(P)/FAD-binding protein YdhS
MIIMRIAIIGGGAATISLLHQLIGKLSGIAQSSEFGFEPIEICIIEKQGEIGPGLAYSTKDLSHILNLPAKVMSPLPEDPKHFFNWAVENKTLWQKDFPHIAIETCDFPPRALYGVYLKCLLVRLIEKAAEEKITVRQLVNHEAVDIKHEAHSGQFRVIFSDSQLVVPTPLLCDRVVLSIGHLESENFCNFKSNTSYIHSPWPVEHLTRISSDSTVFIAGTRLTAIDVILSLKANGHTGQIVLGSRLGLLPCVIGNVDSSFNRKYLTLENIFALSDYGTKKLELEQVIALFKQELDADPSPNKLQAKSKFDLERAIHPTLSPREFLKSEIEEVRTGFSRHWQNVLFSIYSNISVIWDSLSERGKEKFIKIYYSAWMTYLAAFPLENAEKILGYLERHEMEVRGGLQAVSYNARTQMFDVQFEEGAVFQCKYFINATGAGHNVEKTPSTLLQNMIRSGLLVPHHLGGVNVDFKSLQPISTKCVVGLYVMGDSGTYGACMATADLSQQGKQATRIANTIEEQLRVSSANKKVKAERSRTSSDATLSLMFKGRGRSLSAGNIEQSLQNGSASKTPTNAGYK